MIRPISNPLVVAGDMNTTGMDGSVLNIKSAVVKKLQPHILGDTRSQVRDRGGICHGRRHLYLQVHEISKRPNGVWSTSTGAQSRGAIL
jgi:hypothetical protein